MIATPAERASKSQSPELESDGRRQRAARNREAVVGALLAIIKEQDGGPIPGAAEVAARAGVSERTVFRHFADLESLFTAGAAHQRPVVAGYLLARPEDEELEKRIAAVVRLRSKMWEDVGPIRRVALRVVLTDPSLAEILNEANRASRQQLAEVFAPELGRAGREKNLILDELDLIAGFSSWEALRRQMGVSGERARRTLTSLLTGVLAPYARRRRSR